MVKLVENAVNTIIDKKIDLTMQNQHQLTIHIKPKAILDHHVRQGQKAYFVYCSVLVLDR